MLQLITLIFRPTSNIILSYKYILNVSTDWNPSQLIHNQSFWRWLRSILLQIIITGLWDVIPGKSIVVCRRFGGTFCLRLQYGRKKQQVSRKVGTYLTVFMVKSQKTDCLVHRYDSIKLTENLDLNILFPVASHVVAATRTQGSWVQITV
jgi:hypothetical protein